MPIIQSGSASVSYGSFSSWTVNAAGNFTAGNEVVVAVASEFGTGDLTALTVTGTSASQHIAQDDTSNNYEVEIWDVLSGLAGGGTAVAGTLSGSTFGGATIGWVERDDISSRRASSTGGDQNDRGSAAISVTSGTGPAVDDWVVGVASHNSGSNQSLAQASGYTSIFVSNGGAGKDGVAGYKTVTSAGAQVYDPGSTNASYRWHAVIAAYQIATVDPGWNLTGSGPRTVPLRGAGPIAAGPIGMFVSGTPAPLVELAATPSVTATTAAALSVGRPLATAVSASATAAAALSTGRPLASAVTASATIAAALDTSAALQASAAATAAVAAELSVGRPLAAAATATATSTTASLSAGRPLAASASAIATVAAALDAGKPLAAGVNAEVTVSADLQAGSPFSLNASAAAVASVVAGLSVARPLAAGVAVSATSAADLSAGKGLAAASSASATIVAALSTGRPLAASSGATATVVANLLTSQPPELQAAITARATVTADLFIGPLRQVAGKARGRAVRVPGARRSDAISAATQAQRTRDAVLQAEREVQRQRVHAAIRRDDEDVISLVSMLVAQDLLQ